jgi:hypothetical protein
MERRSSTSSRYSAGTSANAERGTGGCVGVSTRRGDRGDERPGDRRRAALYSDSQGVAFAAGTNALATRLP